MQLRGMHYGSDLYGANVVLPRHKALFVYRRKYILKASKGAYNRICMGMYLR